jgi:hypothetical protein
VTDEQVVAVREMKTAGRKVAHIARVTGLSRPTIYRVLIKWAARRERQRAALQFTELAVVSMRGFSIFHNRPRWGRKARQPQSHNLQSKNYYQEN